MRYKDSKDSEPLTHTLNREWQKGTKYSYGIRGQIISRLQRNAYGIQHYYHATSDWGVIYISLTYADALSKITFGPGDNESPTNMAKSRQWFVGC